MFSLFPTVWVRRANPLPPAHADLPRRRPVWAALSTLYLDTELDAGDYDHLAGVLGHSGYDLEQLEEILYREVHPTLVANLLSVAGEWSGFDLVWLEERILRRGPSRSRVALLFGKTLVHTEWSAVRQKLLQQNKP